MEDRIDLLFSEWHRLGGAVLVREFVPPASPRSPEEVLAESTAHCRQSGRLMWVVLAWLIRNVDAIDEAKLIEATMKRGDLSVLGVLCDAARQRHPHPKIDRLLAACQPNDQAEIFFHRVARSPLARRLTLEQPLDLFRRWNYWCAELQYL